MESFRLALLLEQRTHDDDGNGTSADDLRQDPELWARAVTEHGLVLREVRADVQTAQADAEELRAALVALGLSEQADAQASAVGVTQRAGLLRRPTVTGWRGSLALELPDPAGFAARVRRSTGLSLADETAARMPEPFVLPEPLRALLDHAETQGWVDRYDEGWFEPGQRFGLLHPPDVHRGSAVQLRVLPPVGGVSAAAPWLGDERDETAGRLLPFACIGSDGTEAAFWVDDAGRQRIVVLGSGSGSTLACVLADDAVDLLRLLAIGYPDVCWPEEWTAPPVEEPGWPVRNEPYRAWLTTTFGVTVPETAAELVPHPAEMGQTDTQDDFARWLNGIGGR